MVPKDVASDGHSNGRFRGPSTVRDTQSTNSSVDVRAYESSDRRDLQSLYDAVWFHAATDAWFDWLFVENPFLADPPMLVADRGGRVVGIRPVIDVPLRMNGQSIGGTLFTNAMVHPDHHGEGVYSALMDAALSWTRNRNRQLVFAFANENSGPVLAHWGWTAVGPVPKWYRIHRPEALLSDHRLARVIGSVGGPVLRSVLGAMSPSAHSDVDARRVTDPPLSTIARLAREQTVRRLHVERTEQFYRWRLASPLLDTTTFVASIAGRDRAAILTRDRKIADASAVQLFDLVGPGAQDGATVAALIDVLLEENAETPIVTAPGTVWRSAPLRKWAFVSNESRLASLAGVGGFTLFVKPLAGDVDEVDDLRSWSFAGPLIEIV